MGHTASTGSATTERLVEEVVLTKLTVGETARGTTVVLDVEGLLTATRALSVTLVVTLTERRGTARHKFNFFKVPNESIVKINEINFS